MGDTLGGKIGARIADINARARLSTTERMGPLFVKTGMALQEEFFRLTGLEVAKTVGPLYHQLADQPDAPAWFRDTFRFVGAGKGQWATLLAGTTTSAIIGNGLFAVIGNELQPITGRLIASNPHIPLAPADAAAVQIRGLGWGPDLYDDAAQAGINRDRFEAIARVQSTVLAAGDVLELYRRTEIGDAAALSFLKRGGWDDHHAGQFLRLARSFITVQDAAAMWNRDIVTTEEGRQIATHNGYQARDFDAYALLGGEPPDLTAVIQAWQRGVIDESGVDRAIIQGPIRKEWIPVVKALRWEPLPVTEAADAVNQGHLDLAAAQHQATLSGIRPEDFSVIVNNAGIPPGPQEALEWVNRGILSTEDFRTAFLESRIKNKYIDLYLESRFQTMPPETVRLMYRHGALSKEEAIHRLLIRGYDPDTAAIIIDGASAEKTQAERDLTKGELLSLYQARVITRDDLTVGLAGLGYDDHESGLIADLADLRRLMTFTNAAINRVHSSYVARRATDVEASGALDALGVEPDARNDYLTLWDIERTVATKELTTAEVIAATKVGAISLEEAQTRLQGQGYSEDDAVIKLKIAKLIPVS